MPRVVIGVDADRPGHDLFRVVAATRMSDGRIAIANAGTSEIRIFGSSGELVTVTGGEGQGPGELRNMWDMIRLPGDTFLVMSWSPGLTWFSPEGEYVRQTTVNYLAARVPCQLAESGMIAPLGDGRLLMRYEANLGIQGCPPRPDGVFQVDGLVATFDPETDVLDTLAVLPATERNGLNYRVYGRMLVTAADGRHVFAAEIRRRFNLRVQGRWPAVLCTCDAIRTGPHP